MSTETWYILEDGSVGDPREIAQGADGKLRHKDGRAVAYAPHGPRSRGGVDPEKERAKGKKKAPEADPAAAAADAAAAAAAAEQERARMAARDMQPENPRRGYKTRNETTE